MNILLTGGSGFIGDILIKYLHKLNYQVYAPFFNITNMDEIVQSLNALPDIDTVVHLAGLSTFQSTQENEMETFNVNVKGCLNVAEATYNKWPSSNFFFSSSAHVYASNKLNKSEKIVLTELSPTGPISLYGQSKLEAESKLKYFSETSGRKTVIFRFFNHTHKNQIGDVFLPSVYSQMLKFKNLSTFDPNRTYEIKVGNIDIYRDIGSVFDLVKGLEIVLKNSKILENFEIFNICSGQGRLLRELLKILSKKMGIKIFLNEDPSKIRFNEPVYVCGSYSKMLNYFKWKPQIKSNADLIDDFLAKNEI